jgi:hypothetical protein
MGLMRQKKKGVVGISHVETNGVGIKRCNHNQQEVPKMLVLASYQEIRITSALLESYLKFLINYTQWPCLMFTSTFI